MLHSGHEPYATFSRRGFWRGAIAMAWVAGAARGLAHAAAEVEALPEFLASAIAHVRLAGSGVFRWWGFTVYTAAPFALELRYARELKGAAIADKSIEEICELGVGSAAQRDSWLAQMRAIFPNVSDGDVLCGLFEPKAAGGTRTVFLFNGKTVGTVPGDRFALGFFPIWLSAKTFAPDLRTALLAQAAP